mmetsp:Transcript_25305/g.88314  ORF Transcript_25305/g.88314 Transcript_25305/m.88314 type:complete len:288 (-) Transcript_25305:3607-4470(-)
MASAREPLPGAGWAVQFATTASAASPVIGVTSRARRLDAVRLDDAAVDVLSSAVEASTLPSRVSLPPAMLRLAVRATLVWLPLLAGVNPPGMSVLDLVLCGRVGTRCIPPSHWKRLVFVVALATPSVLRSQRLYQVAGRWFGTLASLWRLLSLFTHIGFLRYGSGFSVAERVAGVHVAERSSNAFSGNVPQYGMMTRELVWTELAASFKRAFSSVNWFALVSVATQAVRLVTRSSQVAPLRASGGLPLRSGDACAVCADEGEMLVSCHPCGHTGCFTCITASLSSKR